MFNKEDNSYVDFQEYGDEHDTAPFSHHHSEQQHIFC